MNIIRHVRLPLVFLFFLSVASLPAGALQHADTSLMVPTTAGQIQGSPRPGGGAEFLGIPYARASHRRSPLARTASLQSPGPEFATATTFGAPCSQPDLGDWNRHDAETGKEDCLFLNVIVPAWPIPKPLPVMFWIHGGANEGGTASSALYKDGTLVNHGVILVTVNYRLGIFGFLAHPELTAESPHHASGNYGLMDQILALHWVRDNIAKFGGDVNNITVFGQSAGAMDTSMLMTSPLAKGLFQKALAESGAAFTAPLAPARQGRAGRRQIGESLQRAHGDGPDQIPAHALRAPALLAALAKLDSRSPSPRRTRYRRVCTAPAARDRLRKPARKLTFRFVYGTTTREFGSNESADQLRTPST